MFAPKKPAFADGKPDDSLPCLLRVPTIPLSERCAGCGPSGQGSGSCPGYVIDHVNPLECGGADAPSNMQWQTIADGKAKDKTERLCRN